MTKPTGPLRLTHLDPEGRPTMVDVSSKNDTEREAEAEGWLYLGPEALRLLQSGSNPKGDPLVVAQIAGIQAAKRTAELIPLCHTLPLSRVDVRLEVDRERKAVYALSRVRVIAKTGVEMEALTAVSVALLTAYDMLKAVDRTMRIDGVRLLRKSGGRSGDFHAEALE
jgi:cyclic pyranopterin monophosphate synthase